MKKRRLYSNVWAGHSDVHKQGWIFAPAGILALEEYQGSYRFEECKPSADAPGGSCEFEADPGYPDFWVRKADVSTDPYEPPVEPPDPEPPPSDSPSDEEIGRVIRYLYRG
jgi:hypothetical protein